ncbi:MULTISPECIES: YggT family protein [Paenibacillus]|uniref:YggT family protein n=1 Tax=Paenibacillus tianjinensis TaxID=2810347 RepID=A0ABX7LCY2_9BACL|nr:YggT family protein [Paenibacillus ihuae]QSF43847.1 YggT family protein [Paenibacillus tianjinensis]
MNEVSSIINILFQIYYYMILIYILMSWLPNLRENFIGELLGKLVEPYLSPFRRIIPPLFGTIDISPIIAIIVLRFAVGGLHSIVALIFG